MTEHHEEHKVNSQDLMAKIRNLIREGNVRRIIVRNPKGGTLLNIPLSAGVVGVVLLPFMSAIAALAAVASDYTIVVERSSPTT